jgi:pimeloyl-ACP methyl ester carboxylesterase
MTTQRIDLGGFGLNVVDEGEGAPVVFIHGFPDTSALWRNQFPALTAAGFRCLAPDMRGRGDSDMPPNVADYSLHLPIADLTALLDHHGIERAHIVGHDWGAVVAWLFAIFQPDRTDKLVAMSVGFPGTPQARAYEQISAFWYMFMFQFEGVAEEVIQRHDWAFLRAWGGPQMPDWERYIDDLARPGRLTAALNWYRANATPQILLSDPVELPKVQAPTMGMWGPHDMALLEQQMLASETMVANEWRYERVEGAGHWLQLDHAAEVNALLIHFLT